MEPDSPPPGSHRDTIRVIERPEEAALLLDPVRQRLLRNLEFPISASGLARRLHLPRQKVNYHLRELERAGFVRLVRERRVGNCTERLVQAETRTVRLHPELLGPLSPEPRTPAEWERLFAVRFADAESRTAFEEGLAAAVARLVSEHGVPEEDEPTAIGGMGEPVTAPDATPGPLPEPWQVLVSLHPGGRRRRRFPDPG